MTTFSWSLFWGVFFGLTNALLSGLVCLIWNALLFTVPIFGYAGGSLNDFFNGMIVLAYTPEVVEWALLALWVSVIGGAVIGIVSERDEGATPLIHQRSQK